MFKILSNNMIISNIVPKFKINILNNETTTKIIVFFGYYQNSMEELTTLFRENPRNNIFKVSYANSENTDDLAPFIFSHDELEHLNLDIVSFTHLLINEDDSIETIKNKIFIADQSVPVNQLYLMSKLDEYQTLGLVSQTFQANPFFLEEKEFELGVNNNWMTPTTDNNIFVCYYENVREFLGPGKDVFLKQYFPNNEVSAENILSLEPFYNKIDMFYNVYQNKKRKLNYRNGEVGIKIMDFIVKGNEQIPIRSIFNISHCTEKMPMIKYNTPKKGLNIIRFFTKELSKSGIKIPFSSLASMNSFDKEIDKKLSVCYFIQDGTFICQLFENGDIRIRVEFKNDVDISQCIDHINAGIDEIFNPLILFFTQMKITKPFITLEFLENITFTNLICVIKLIGRDLRIPFDCIKSVFAVEYTTAGSTALLYKRIPHFNIQSSMEVFIESSIKKGVRDIVKNLMENYNINSENASSVFDNFSREYKEKERIGRRILLINPGLPVTITMNPLENINIFQIHKIPKLNIIKHLFIFIDSMIRISMPDYTTYPQNLIKENCSVETRIVEVKYNAIHRDIILEPESPRDSPRPGDLPEPDLPEPDLPEPDLPEPEGPKKIQDIDAINRFLAMNSDSESDEEGDFTPEDEPEDMTQIGGENVKERRIRLRDDNEYVQKLLANSSLHDYFAKRMGKYDKNIFDKPGGDDYSRACQANRKRQPVVLNREELDTINRETPGLIDEKNDEVLQYTTEEGEDLYYICPRYWCLLDNTPMTKEQVESGDCGGIVDKKIENKKYVVEFFHKELHGTREDYKKTGPGLMKNNLPCCFGNWKSERQKKLINESEDYTFFNRAEPRQAIIVREKIEPAIKHDKFVIIQTEKFPLDEYTWGYPPKSIQIFFNDFNEDHEISELDHTLKKNELCIMRHGIENSQQKSFLACVADIRYFTNGVRRGESYLVQLINLITARLTLDIFVTLQNGSLIETFADPITDVDVEDFNNQKIYTLMKDNPNDLLKICSAYKNYIDFLKGDNYIDYTYTWDLLTRPAVIFSEGVNVVIFDLENETHIKLICPANHYSGNFFNPMKKNIVILKSGRFFEPLFTFIKRTEIKTDPYFILNELPENIKEAFGVISAKLAACEPLKSSDTYNFEQPILLTSLIEKCLARGFKPVQVVNTRGKVVGVKLYKGQLIGFLPCFPSSIDDSYDYILLDEDWNTYSETIAFLSSMEDVPCKIYSQLAEEGQIIGFLTVANQFVPIIPISLTESNGIRTSSSYNHYNVDNAILTNDDNERIEYINKIKIDFELENIFCSYLIYLLNFETNKELLNEIIALTSPVILEEYGIHSIIELLKKLPVIFIEDYTDVMFENTRNCFLHQPPIYFPLNHEKRYYTKLATYIFKYHFVQQNLQNVNIYFMFNPANLTVRENEIYIMQNFISNNMFIFFKRESFMNMNMKETYDTVEPKTDLLYGTNINFTELITVKSCQEKNEFLRNVKWGRYFVGAREISFTSADNSCSFVFALSIINKIIEPITKENVIEILDSEYLSQMEIYTRLYGDGYYKKVLGMLKNEGKEMIGAEDKIIHHMLHSDYYLTVTDLWLLFNRLNIPVAFLSSHEMKNMHNKKIFFTNTGKGRKYVFIIVPKPTKFPIYKYIMMKGEILLDVEEFCDKSEIELENIFFYDHIGSL